jgi:hypothetical protein
LAANDLQARLPEVRRTTLRRRLSNLILEGLLERHEVGHSQLYELTARARHLAIVAMLAGRWEWQWFRPADAVPARDFIDLVHVLAPVAEVSTPTAGVCQFHLETDGAVAPDVYLAALDGRILALTEAPANPPEAVGRASIEAWCEALLMPNGGIRVAGNHTLMLAVISALAATLRAKPPQTSTHGESLGK